MFRTVIPKVGGQRAGTYKIQGGWWGEGEQQVTVESTEREKNWEECKGCCLRGMGAVVQKQGQGTTGSGQ